MTERRRGAALAALSLLFLAATSSLYLWAIRADGDADPSRPSAAARPEAQALPSERGTATRPPALPRAAPRGVLTRPAPPGGAPPAEPDPTPAADADPLDAAELSVRVVDDRGEPLRHVPVVVASEGGGRGRRYATDAEGRLVQRVEPGVLSVLAERADGMLVTRSEPVTVDARAGGRWDVELVVPSEERAGLGVGIAPAEEGVRVTAIHPGTPAEEAGLEVGDVITAVEGEPTEGMALPDFVARMTGPPGSKVLFDLRRADGSEERLQIERRRIEAGGGGPR